MNEKCYDVVHYERMDKMKEVRISCYLCDEMIQQAERKIKQ